jgi:flagellar biosynthesis protein FliQ
MHFGGIKKSFEIVPPFSFALSENQSEFLLQRLRESFYVSLQIAFPVILAMFVIEISIAIISAKLISKKEKVGFNPEYMANDTARAIPPLIIGNIICDENIGTENKRKEVLMNIGENSMSF